MPKVLVPGVYIEEVHFASHPIEGVSTSTVGFVAVTGRSPLLGPLTSFVDFERVATPNLGVNLPLAVRGFFDNGGQRCVISQIGADDPLESGLAALDEQRANGGWCVAAGILGRGDCRMQMRSLRFSQCAATAAAALGIVGSSGQQMMDTVCSVIQSDQK